MTENICLLKAQAEHPWVKPLRWGNPNRNRKRPKVFSFRAKRLLSSRLVLTHLQSAVRELKEPDQNLSTTPTHGYLYPGSDQDLNPDLLERVAQNNTTLSILGRKLDSLLSQDTLEHTEPWSWTQLLKTSVFQLETALLPPDSTQQSCLRGQEVTSPRGDVSQRSLALQLTGGWTMVPNSPRWTLSKAKARWGLFLCVISLEPLRLWFWGAGRGRRSRGQEEASTSTQLAPTRRQ